MTRRASSSVCCALHFSFCEQQRMTMWQVERPCMQFREARGRVLESVSSWHVQPTAAASYQRPSMQRFWCLLHPH